MPRRKKASRCKSMDIARQAKKAKQIDHSHVENKVLATVVNAVR